MNLNALLTFVKVVQIRSFKETARQLNITQPAVTQRIQTLEDTLGVRLLNRDAEGVEVTAAGSYVYKQSLSIIHQWEHLVQRFQGDAISGRLVIGASTIPSEFLLPHWLSQFHQQYPQIQLQMQVAGTAHILQRLREGTLDVAITGEPETKTGLYLFPIHDDQLQVIAPPSTPVDTVSLEQLLQQEWVMRERDSDTLRHWLLHMKRYGYDLDDFTLVGEVGSSQAIISCVEAGLGWSVVSRLAAHHARQCGRVKLIQVEQMQIPRSFYFATLEENRNQGLIHILAQFLQTTSQVNSTVLE